MMLHRIAATHGDELAAQIGEQMLHEKIRPGAMRQHAAPQTTERRGRGRIAGGGPADAGEYRAPLDLVTLADRLGQSRRNVERLFRKYLDCSPARYYLGLRLMRARQLLSQTHMSVMEVALCCGFVSATHFSQRYRYLFRRSAAQRSKQPSRRAAKAAEPQPC